MRDQHIISILEKSPLTSLDESELTGIRTHTGHCSECMRAYEAAQISALLLKERAASAVAPSPFFQTRVMAALRERQAANEPSELRRMWQAAGALVSLMAVIVAVLAILVFLAPTSQTTSGPQEVVSVEEPHAAEELLLAQDDLSDNEMSYEEVLTTIYESEEDVVR